MKPTKLLSWKPILRGKIYCSPACGRGCTKAAHDKACEEAKRLAKRMGKGWTTRVWENLGWHYCVNSPCQRIKVHPSQRVKWFSAFLGSGAQSGGQWVESGNTPEKAVGAVVKAARADLARIGEVIKGL